LLLAIRPELVRPELAAAGPTPSLDDLVSHGVAALSPSGVLGDPTGASAAHGRAVLDRLVDDLRRSVADTWPVGSGRAGS
jgi:creatinine amidohydrolase